MKKSVLLLLALWLCHLTLMATTVSQQWAKQIAAQFLSDKSTSHRSFSASQMQTAVVFEAQIGVSTPAEPLYSSLLWTFLVSENTVTAGYSNLFGVPNTLELGLAYLDESGTLEPIVTKEEEVPQEMSFKEIAYTVQPTDKPQGTYKIVPISRIKGSTLWTIERYRYVWASFDGTTVKLTPSAPQLEATDVQAIGSKRAKLDQEVSFVLTNKGSEFLDEIYLFASTTEEKGKVQSHCVVTVEENGSQPLISESEEKALLAGSALAVEARYERLSRYMRETGCRNLLDIACGYTPRAIYCEQEGIDYVGLEVPVVAEELLGFASRNRIGKSHPAYVGGDATNAASLLEAAEWLHRMYAEGLLDIDFISQGSSIWAAKVNEGNTGMFSYWRLQNTALNPETAADGSSAGSATPL